MRVYFVQPDKVFQVRINAIRPYEGIGLFAEAKTKLKLSEPICFHNSCKIDQIQFRHWDSGRIPVGFRGHNTNFRE